MSVTTGVRTAFEYPGRDASEFDRSSRPAIASLVRKGHPETTVRRAMADIGRSFDGRDVRVFATGPEIFVVAAHGEDMPIPTDQPAVVARFSSARVRFTLMEPAELEVDAVVLGSAAPRDAARRFSAYVREHLAR
ncbi:hypothetical protein GCM10025865_20070 [Paraoerskovia sediminicola]|uniref:Uncharacterized protein n=1 Tax=Paraoerskovia sediminicola TaxID=1138587 RepID=A0ABN6XF36_9CELL|nr:hypothetical protein [Paraoerskovia sediminicola]BDZ42708.1 hypothetical protein GCM10025865_20070 [Paraoerskovia sediminicola]